MSLNRVSNPRKLRQLSRAAGEPIVRAYARWFAGHTLLLFGESGRQYAAEHNRARAGWEIEPYTHDPPLTFTDDGIRHGG